MTENHKASNGSVFISYSRKDKPFIQKLNDALAAKGVRTWVDWEGIELASDWVETITSAIQGTDALIFVISPDSLKSKVCTDELELGLKLNKKLIPILYREPGSKTRMHEKLAATNWVYLRDQDNFDETIPKLIQSINTDLGWVRQHTQLLGQAIEWEKKNKNNSFLLHGSELEDAERWMAEASGKENREVLPIQAEFISSSRIITTRNQRRLVVTMSVLVVAAIVFGFAALISRNRAQNAEAAAKASEATAIANEKIAATQRAIAEENQKIAEENQKLAEEKTNLANAERSAAQAQILQSRAGELDTSTLLAIDSYQRNASFQAENIIRVNSSLLLFPVAQMSQDGPIWNIEWSPDYEYFVTGNNHDPADENAVNEACVWHGSNGEKLYCVQHENDVNDAIFPRDGRFLITASADQSVKFWDAASGDPLKSLEFEGAVLDLDVSESVLAIGREDNFLTLYYFDKPDLKPIDYVQIYGVKTVKFSPNGVLLAFGLQNGDVRFWQAKDKFFYSGPKHPESSYIVLAFSPDNNWLVSGGSDSIARLTKRDGAVQYGVKHQDWVEGVAFGPDPSWFVTVSDDNIVRVLETSTGAEKFKMSHSNFAQKVIVSSDGQWIASTGYDHVVRIWDSVSGSQRLEFPLDANGSAISFNKDGTRIVATDEDGNISIWDTSMLKARLGYIEFPEFVRKARFTPTGEFLVVNADDYSVWALPGDQVNEIQSGTEGKVILTTESLTYETAISPDSKWVSVIEYDSEDAQKNQATLVSIDGKTRFQLEHGGEVTSVSFTQDSNLVGIAGIDGLLSFWDVQSGNREFDLDNSEPVLAIATSPVAPLAAAGLHNKIRIWDTDTREQITDLQQTGEIVSIAFSQDGKWLATGSTEGTVILWAIDGNTISQKNMLQLNGFPRALAFSPDNQWLAGGGSIGFAYLWDIATMQEMTRIPHGNPVTSVSFSTNGTQLLTVSRKVIRIWDVSTLFKVTKDQLISSACSHLVKNLSREDWAINFGQEEYRPLCPNLPEGS
ncbi:MAG: TIR domain-containing protein [Anaerolineae bacterium]|nr:TIR domain-containing protein [Anaerolineae bacterium]